jgi:hypothetical protein
LNVWGTHYLLAVCERRFLKPLRNFTREQQHSAYTAEDERYITNSGKTAGGEFRLGKGPYFLWPRDLQI